MGWVLSRHLLVMFMMIFQRFYLLFLPTVLKAWFLFIFLLLYPFLSMSFSQSMYLFIVAYRSIFFNYLLFYLHGGLNFNFILLKNHPSFILLYPFRLRLFFSRPTIYLRFYFFVIDRFVIRDFYFLFVWFRSFWDDWFWGSLSILLLLGMIRDLVFFCMAFNSLFLLNYFLCFFFYLFYLLLLFFFPSLLLLYCFSRVIFLTFLHLLLLSLFLLSSSPLLFILLVLFNAFCLFLLFYFFCLFLRNIHFFLIIYVGSLCAYWSLFKFKRILCWIIID